MCQGGETMLSKMMSQAEGMVGTAGGAASLWKDAGRIAAVRDALRRPASGVAYTQVQS